MCLFSGPSYESGIGLTEEEIDTTRIPDILLEPPLDKLPTISPSQIVVFDIETANSGEE